MKNLWNQAEADQLGNDLVKLRVYTSRLLGQEGDLVLHGGGNTSVKVNETNIFGEEEEVIYVKGSGWDLGTIEAAGFAPCKMKDLLQLAALDELSDVEMVKYQRMAMTNPSAPNASIEAILHALIPFKFVDHTHADAVVTITNTPNGEQKIKEIYGENMVIVPYVMPGFVLAKAIYDITKGLDWSKLDGMILLNHGVFTFDDDAKASYDKMIAIVSKAEDYLAQNAPNNAEASNVSPVDALAIAKIRKQVSELSGKAVLAQLDGSEKSVAFSQLTNVVDLTSRGTLTPDHIIRTKRTPVVITGDHEENLRNYATTYQQYFDQYNNGETCLDLAPRWAVMPGQGILSFGPNVKSSHIIRDIAQHTMKAIFQAEQLGGWTVLPNKDFFEIEYWELEQMKLKKGGASKEMQGKIALVTGAANGIGKACVERLLDEGAVVVALDINPNITTCFNTNSVLGVECDVNNTDQMQKAIDTAVAHFGGLDMLVANAGIFPESNSIANMNMDTWNKSMDINLTSYQQLFKMCYPYLSEGINPAIVIIGSKNVPAPGPGAAAYSVAKAGLAQLGRIAALEFGEKGIRVNTLHPHLVYDTGIWTDEILEGRAKNYGLTVEEYKTNNILKIQLASKDVAETTLSLLSNSFRTITGAQIAIDGGNDRTI
jgi:rhamnose utilization protein RhaD (predicted bifunctional aldolase and dehydrogenase)/NAD(P)-dependent dehydrogenase (short-subunit alcohol dehydrogenase family)